MKHTICIVGLGYVGLPLAHAFAKKGYTVLGYDIAEQRIEELKEGHDRTRELTKEQLKKVTMEYSADPAVIQKADVIILAIPTPVDENNNPDLTLVESASRTVGKHLKEGAIVVYESTVYPGVTEELCGDILEQESGLKRGKDFFVGYSPERVNPGDKKHTIDKIVKIVAGEDEKTTDTLCELYGSIVTAGIHRAPNMKTAEMAKAIENAQRDLNIAFVNEVALLCNKLGIRSKDVLEAAGTKWNFLKFQPGLVGGHCIGVDPYYLVEKAKMLGMTTHVITAGRSVNDGMGRHVAEQTLQAMKTEPKNAKVLVLGLTFKEDIPDIRNSKCFDVIKHLVQAGCAVSVHDPEVGDAEITRLGYTPGTMADGPFDAILLLVPHRAFVALPTANYIAALQPKGVFYDLKSVYAPEDFVRAEQTYLSL